MARVTVVDITSFADASAARIAEFVEQSIAQRGVAHVALTGGHTPELTYAALADPARPHRDCIDWSRVQLYWGDERHVPPDHPDSNFGMPLAASLSLLRTVRAVPGLASVPVAIVTSDYYLDDPQKHELQALGAELHYAPLWLDELVTVARGLIIPRD